MLQNISHFLSESILYWASPKGATGKRWISWLWISILFLGGALAWGYFFSWGNAPYGFHDWNEITLPRLVFLSNAMRQGVWPLHILDKSVFNGVTDRFLTIPDAYFSPQFILLRWMEIRPFILFNFLLFYAVGFAGLVWIARRQHLSGLTFTLLFLLFNFNGHLVAHLSVGHYTWIGYFFFPWLVGLALAFLDGESGWPWVMKVSLLLLVMLLQGGYHQYIYSLFLIALLIPLAPRRFSTLGFALVFSVLLAVFRLAPPVMNLGKFDNHYTAGYPFLNTILFALTNIYVPNDFTINNNLTQQIGTWEYAFYIGLIGVLFLAWFGLVSTFRKRQAPGNYAALLIPVIGLIFLSLDRVFYYLRIFFPLPIITGERVPARIFSLAFILVLILAVIEFQRWLDHPERRNILVVLGCAGIVAILTNDLWENVHLWRISESAKLFTNYVLDPSPSAVANHPDPAYFQVLALSGVVSFLALLVLIGLRCRPFTKLRPALLKKQPLVKETPID